jgi:hypothetical protein
VGRPELRYVRASLVDPVWSWRAGALAPLKAATTRPHPHLAPPPLPSSPRFHQHPQPQLSSSCRLSLPLEPAASGLQLPPSPLHLTAPRGQPHLPAMATTNVPVTLDTPIVVKILFRGQTKKFKLPLKDLGAHVLPDKVRCPRTAASGARCQPGPSAEARNSSGNSLILTCFAPYSSVASSRSKPTTSWCLNATPTRLPPTSPSTPTSRRSTRRCSARRRLS